jgi:hypothetical protein
LQKVIGIVAMDSAKSSLYEARWTRKNPNVHQGWLRTKV